MNACMILCGIALFSSRDLLLHVSVADLAVWLSYKKETWLLHKY